MARCSINRAKVDVQDDESTDALIPVMLTLVRCRKDAEKEILKYNINRCLPEDDIFRHCLLHS